MKMFEVASGDADKIVGVFRDFLLLCKEELDLEKMPPIEWQIDDGEKQTSFGSFNSENNAIKISIKNRHPNDIMRTLAHELVHYRQQLDGRIKPNSGETGSPIENEAHAIAGIIMRKFNHSHPRAFSILDESILRKYNKL